MSETLLPKSATAFERSLTDAMERATDLPVPIADLAAVETVPGDFVPWLAWGLSTDLWDRNWSLEKKRSVAKAWYRLHRLKGTLAGTKQHLAFFDAKLIDYRIAPEGYFAAPSVPKEELDAYIERHPKVRILLGSARGSWGDVDGFIADHAFVGDATTHIDDAAFLYGRKAVLVERGVERPLRVATFVDSHSCCERGGVTIEQVRVPGKGVAFSHAGEFAADDSFADAFDDPPRAYTYTLPRKYRHDASRLELTRVPVGFQPREMRYRRESETGSDTAPAIFSGDFAGEGFAGVNDALFLLADVIRLIDPQIASPVVNSGSFADYNRVGLPAHTAELQVDWQHKVPARSAVFSNETFVGDDAVSPVSTVRRDELLAAIVVSKRLSDKILVTFQKQRPRTLADGIRLDRNMRLDEAVPNTL